MSLLMNEDFSIYQLRLGYLNNIRDGVGERLINLNPAILNNPAFRTAGWVPDVAAIKRCHSPPIPTGTSDINNEYFQRPRRAVAAQEDEVAPEEFGRGMVTGIHGSDDTLGPAGLQANERKRERRRRKEQLEDDDSSDLTDDSEDESEAPTGVVKFDRIPMRDRSKSSPPTRPATSRLESEFDGPAATITGLARPIVGGTERLRSGSLGAIERIRTRPRRDTTTSSEMSSENEYAPDAVRAGRPGKGRSVLALEDDIKEEEESDIALASDLDDEGTDVGDQVSDLSDEEFEHTAGSGSLLVLGVAAASDELSSSVIRPPPVIIPAITPANSSPKRFAKDALPKLPKLPAGQRVQSTQGVSMLSMLLKGKDGGAGNEKPFQRFAEFSGKGEATPLWIKIYAPFSSTPTEPIEVPMRKTKDDKPVTVAELIGLALWRYEEEEYQPALQQDERNINRWTLRIVEDEEVDFDFPALGRTRPVTDFTSNNNRPPQRRARDKPWDEFGLVKATDEQFAENEALTPQVSDTTMTKSVAAMTPRLEVSKPLVAGSIFRSHSDGPITTATTVNTNPITAGIPFGAMLRKDSTVPPMDAPQTAGPRGATKMGPPCTVTVQYTDSQSFVTRNEQFETTTDSYIGDIFEQSCRRLNLDKASHVLKIHGTSTVAPNDCMVEVLGEKLHLNLVRRRFQDIGPHGSSPVSGISPDLPVDMRIGTSNPSRYGKAARLATTTKVNATTETIYRLNKDGGGKRYNVIRKQPLSFAAPHPRTLIITPEYMTIMPAAPDSLAAPIGKITNVAMSSVIGAKISRKHPAIFKIFVMRNRETKRYDFEAKSKAEAESAVADVRKGMQAAGGGPSATGLFDGD
ncbi:uncharacterized protein K489DRAFT_410671 [Dissoconium aciculare CBS 342.82]|uniref:SIN1-domain-containing protein n=1 Tax=Dissoconium aciculare CBS 342.82 TaxID=1314786 RepID=A0A6J3M664_9PEZI|nr:uncharacterized protein K489DRAFT_410671 [Dissoconium aciculare CBS 342.82]KAF1822352.1 hypothetical protein K489DRAFT_410671 [Dissoconium aciculare CBS 342.82]